MLTVATAQTFSGDNTGSTLCASGFVDDVMFGDNQPGKGITIRACTQNDPPEPGVKSDVSDCLVDVILIVSPSGGASLEGRCPNKIRNSTILM